MSLFKKYTYVEVTPKEYKERKFIGYIVLLANEVGKGFNHYVVKDVETGQERPTTECDLRPIFGEELEELYTKKETYKYLR